MNELLEIKNLSVEYHTDAGVVHAVNGLNFKIDKHETHGLVGETGAGKTTTALSIMQLIPDPPGEITSGEILLEGKDLMKVPESEMYKIRGNKISMIFQDPMTSLNPVMTVGQQIEEVISLHQEVSKDDLRKKAIEMLEVVGIRKERIDDYPHQFSGGMKQRVVIAMALACNPSLIIADEPTTALDVTIQAQVLALIKDLKEKYDTSMILITHDLGVVAETCDKVSVCYGGTIVEHASVKDLFETPYHPYTKALFSAIPKIDEDVERLETLSVTLPDFSKIKPEYREVSPGHFVAFPLTLEEEGDDHE
ncbi:ABC transporter ATP-binding protein [Atopobacter sp. AH10]|uniref:ABC transporter ATP-binding protein n=1 Tax=Atopobacter sp. AH10 TaxID=2315861 RepID=UPI000EF21379|nr:ABC transporter ATP-binding protein [Atopobacter sp. AH10]RLK64170.1 ABC transporter ATP-binding protein [Atopobacter sp. AH10]